MGVRLLPLGTTNEIGDACYLLDIDGTSVLLDAGAHPRKEGLDSLPDFHLFQDRNVDAILISHCHLDHIAALPVAISYFPHARVFMSEASSVLAPLTLRQTARVMRRQEQEGTAGPPLFSATDVDLISYLFQGFPSERPFPIYNPDPHGADLTAKFYDAGHILGAAGIWLQGPSGTIFYTGDTAAHPQEILSGAVYPEEPVDLLITECTLSADPRAEYHKRRGEINRFARSITEVLESGGSVLIPAFALGRTQEMLALLHRLRLRGRIPDVDIYTAGSGGSISEIYDRTASYTRRQNPDLRLRDLDILPLPSGDVRSGSHLRRPAIFVVSSGMMAAHTLSFKLAEAMLPHEKHGIFFVGYVDSEMPGHRVLTAPPDSTVQLDPVGPELPVRCRISRFFFTAHSHRRHLLRLVDRLAPKTVALVHGEPAATAWMKQALGHRHPNTRILLPQRGIETEI